MLKFRFWLDVLNFSIFMVVLEPHFTGEDLHEWIAMAAIITLIVHFLFHWDWFLRITTSFTRNLFHISRLNHIIAFLIFVGFTTLMTSGLMISRSFLPTFGIHEDPARGWKAVHELAANLTLILVALHFALHWDWVKNMLTKFIVTPLRGPKMQQDAKHD